MSININLYYLQMMILVIFVNNYEFHYIFPLLYFLFLLMEYFPTDLLFKIAPFSTNNLTTSKCPSDAARCKGVRLS